MKKNVLSTTLWAAVLICLLTTSCGSKRADHSDPKSVADIALECYDTGDYARLKTLVSPTNEYLLEEMDKMIERAKEFSAQHPDTKHEKKERTYRETTEHISGREITEESKMADVEYDGVYPTKVILERVDGKWYFERFR